MARDNVGTIRITHRLLEVGGQVYPLAHISRVQTLWIEWGRKITNAREVLLFVLVLVGAIYLVPALGGIRDPTPLVAVLVLLAVLVLGVRAFGRKRRYVLVVETSGAQSTALASKTRREIDHLRDEITAAIENPPVQERLIHLSGDIVMGDKVGRDKYEQSGTGNKFDFT